MLSPRRAFESLENEVVHPVLDPRGFKQNRLAFVREYPEISQIVWSQVRSDHSCEKVSFTMEFDILSHRVAHFRDIDAEPNIGQCVRRSRIGRLVSPPEALWLTIDAATDQDGLFKDVLSIIDRFGMPFLDQVSSDHDLINLWLEERARGSLTIDSLMALTILNNDLGPEDLLPEIVQDLANRNSGTV